MQALDITPVKHPLEATVTMPGSKSYTQRALVLAALAEGESVLQNPLVAEDTGYLIAALRLLGTDILNRDGELFVTGTGGRLVDPLHQRAGLHRG